jgi:hypothetical protein
VCQFLHGEHCQWDSRATNYSAFAGYAHALRWLLQHDCPVDLGHEGLLFVAAIGGHTSVLHVLLDAEVLVAPAQAIDTLSWACEYKQLAAAKWLKQHGAEWPAVLCDDYGDPWLDAVVAWARSEGCTSPTSD